MAFFATVEDLPVGQQEEWNPPRRPVPPKPRPPRPRIPPRPPRKPLPKPIPPAEKPKPNAPIKCPDGQFRVKAPPGSKVLILCKPRRIKPIEKLPEQIPAKPKPLPAKPKPVTPVVIPRKPRTRRFELRPFVKDEDIDLYFKP